MVQEIRFPRHVFYPIRIKTIFFHIDIYLYIRLFINGLYTGNALQG